MTTAVVPALITTSYADGRNWDDGCENNGGNEPSGQEGKCKGGGLTAFVENGGGNRPPPKQP